MLKGIQTLTYFVDDVFKGADWYAKVLGVEPYHKSEHYCGFNIGGYELGVHPGGKPTNDEGGVQGFWGVDNVEAAIKHWTDNGATQLQEPTDVGGEIIIGSVKDPWGNVVGFISNPNFKPGAQA
jgi:lactoylglutathione lyase